MRYEPCADLHMQTGYTCQFTYTTYVCTKTKRCMCVDCVYHQVMFNTTPIQPQSTYIITNRDFRLRSFQLLLGKRSLRTRTTFNTAKKIAVCTHTQTPTHTHPNLHTHTHQCSGMYVPVHRSGLLDWVQCPSSC